MQQAKQLQAKMYFFKERPLVAKITNGKYLSLVEFFSYSVSVRRFYDKQINSYRPKWILPKTPSGGKNYKQKNVIFDRDPLLTCVYPKTKFERATSNRSIVIIRKRFLPKSSIFSNSDLDLRARNSKIDRDHPLSICNTPVKFH